MIHYEQAATQVDDLTKGKLVEVQTIPALDAVGFFLAEDVCSRVELPPFNKSAMDGFAVCQGDERTEYQWNGETIAAGASEIPAIQPGQTVKVMTGAPVPQGTGKVIMVEHTHCEGSKVTVAQKSSRPNICLKGEDLKVGDVVLTKGQRLDPVAVSAIIASGNHTVKVYRRVKISIIVTGDEIVDSFDQLAFGKIMNSNGPLLCSLAKQFNLQLLTYKNVSDDTDALKAQAQIAVKDADILIFTGGVSMGDYDFVPQIIESLGFTIHFRKVAMKPGKPLTFATRDNKFIFGLPGNPVSVYSTFHHFVLRVVRLISGATAPTRTISLPLGEDFTRKKGTRLEFVPAYIDPHGKVRRVPYHGSAHLSALVKADGFFAVEKGCTIIKSNTIIPFYPFSMKGW